MSHPISAIRRVVVGLVVNGSDALVIYEVMKFLTAKGTKRLSGIAHHGRKSVNAGAAQHVQEHRLGEVVHGVTSQRPRRKNPTSLGTSARFKVSTRLDHHVVHDAGHVEAST